MALYMLSPSMAEYCGLLVQLVSHHVELDPCTALAGSDERRLRRQMRHDSMGIWLVGGVWRVRELSVNTQALWGAQHPALMTAKDGRFAAYTRGFEYSAYSGAYRQSSVHHRAVVVPEDEIVDQVIALWDFHEMRSVDRTHWRWALGESF